MTLKKRMNYSQIWQIVALGGGSFLAYLFCFPVSWTPPRMAVVAWTAYALAVVVNYPHFLLSYQLLYWDHRKSLFKSFGMIWAAVVVPVILIGMIAVGVSTSNSEVFVGLTRLMYILVGWHYVKQVYGAVIVTSIQRKFFYSPLERWLIKGALYCIWGLNWIWTNTRASLVDFYGIQFLQFNLSPLFLTASYWVTGAVIALLAVVLLRRFQKTRKFPPLVSCVSFLSIYLWYLPIFVCPGFFYFIPLFHSLQYMPFVMSFKTNQTGLKLWSWGLAKYFGLAIVLGAVFFMLIPRGIDFWIQSAQHVIITPALCLVAFNLFLNIHHYFIDHVIWRSTNPEVKKYLFLGKAQ